MTQPEPYETALGAAGYRLTGPRRAVAGLIAGRSGHFTSADLLADARAQQLGIGRATVFRALDVLLELGAVERIDLPSGEHAYVACEPTHHHHVVCDRCGKVAAFGDTDIRPCRDDDAVACQTARGRRVRIRWLEGREVVPTITALHGHHDRLRAAELERAKNEWLVATKGSSF